MQITTETKHVVSLTIEDIRSLLKAQHGLEGDIEVKIVDQEEAIKVEENPWIEVPKNWSYKLCPTNGFYPEDLIEVELRNGEITKYKIGTLTVSWVQGGHPMDIRRYRKAKD